LRLNLPLWWFLQKRHRLPPTPLRLLLALPMPLLTPPKMLLLLLAALLLPLPPLLPKLLQNNFCTISLKKPPSGGFFHP